MLKLCRFLLTKYSFVCYIVYMMRNNERENTMKILISKDTFIPSLPWRIDLITPKGKCFMGSHRTKKDAIELCRDSALVANKNATIVDTRTGKVL